MRVFTTDLPGVLVIEPKRITDARGFFVETYHRERYREAGITLDFVQDNLSFSHRGVLRGLHLQHPKSQGKLVWVVEGCVFDVAVDVRVGSPFFGKWVGVELSSENLRELWIPPGFAHGFMVLSERCLFAYKCTEFYDPNCEIGIAWNDPTIGIAWPWKEPILSPKDARNPKLSEIDLSLLPQYAP
ncbi:MAG: dTDP-4-dehydrorhamnose 3,5-epimerase [Sandaracinaceae bacterium]|nr:dTDP-4-dehydrorhamnose 3,5-epimerase [Sandaracinaceae bacterium]